MKDMRHWRLGGVILACISVFSAPCNAQTDPASESGVGPLLRAERTAHPKAEIADMYKLFYQGAFGIGHMISDRERATAFLNEEIAEMGPAPVEEPLLQLCATDSSQYRLHLRPFIKAGLDTRVLLDAVMESAAMHGHDTVRFLRQWEEAGIVLQSANPSLYAAYIEFTARMKEAGYPAVHHSEAYRNAYSPAYRVLHKAAIKNHFPGLLAPGE